MNKPFIDPRHFKNKPWRREMMWVQRNALGIIVGIEEKMPESDNVNLDLPTIATLKNGEKPNARI